MASKIGRYTPPPTNDSFLQHLHDVFGGYRWYRRLIGGHWELWIFHMSIYPTPRLVWCYDDLRRPGFHCRLDPDYFGVWPVGQSRPLYCETYR